MFSAFKRMSKSEKGLGTVEIVIIIAVLVGIALMFSDAIREFLSSIINSVFGEGLNEDLSRDTLRQLVTPKP